MISNFGAATRRSISCLATFARLKCSRIARPVGTLEAHGTDEANIWWREVVAQGCWPAIHQRIAERYASRIFPEEAPLAD
jgi:hypothetical protein